MANVASKYRFAQIDFETQNCDGRIWENWISHRPMSSRPNMGLAAECRGAGWGSTESWPVGNGRMCSPHTYSKFGKFVYWETNAAKNLSTISFRPRMFPVLSFFKLVLLVAEGFGFTQTGKPILRPRKRSGIRSLSRPFLVPMLRSPTQRSQQVSLCNLMKRVVKTGYSIVSWR